MLSYFFLKVGVLLLSLLSLEVFAYAQTLSLEFKEARLEAILNKIKKQTGYNYIINGKALKDTLPITVSLNAVPLAIGLRTIIRDTNLVFIIKRRTILLIPRTKAKSHLETKDQIVIDSLFQFLDK